MNKENILLMFNERLYRLDSDKIRELDKTWKMPDLKNVIVGLNEHCYGAILLDESKANYQLLYVNGRDELIGYIFENSFENSFRDNLAFLFADFLSLKFKGLDTINAFNTFQHYTRSLLENIGIMTLSTTEIEKYEDQNPVIVGATVIKTINKESFYKEHFQFSSMPEYTDSSNYIYLMLNKRNNFVKIGRSINPIIRERTLQAEDPNNVIIAYWKAPSLIEKELHQSFSNKRVRGEWFDLTFNDLIKIKDIMSIYNESN